MNIYQRKTKIEGEKTQKSSIEANFQKNDEHFSLIISSFMLEESAGIQGKWTHPTLLHGLESVNTKANRQNQKASE